MKKVIKEEFIFLVLVCLVFAFGAYTLVKNPKKTSVAENRNLTQFSHFTISTFLNGKFQDNFEKALADQFPMSEKIRVGYGNAINTLSDFGLDDLLCKNRYIELNGKNYSNVTFNCDDYIMSLPMNIDPLNKKVFASNIVDQNIEKYNHVNSLIDTYYYYINEPQTFNFENGKKVIDLEQILREKLTGKYKISSLQFSNYEEYKKYFYKTDHHWNYIGSYKGYLDITKMLGIKNPSEPIGMINNHEYFFGFHARDARYYDSKEELIAYDFNLPEHDTYIDRKLGEYGSIENYKNHAYKYNKNSNYYGYVFGYDNGEILFDYHQPEKDNLLIISNSFDNPINALIAQHFNKTYDIDLRTYKKDLKEDFVLSEYIEKNDIDKVLFVINPRFIYDENSNQGLEK